MKISVSTHQGKLYDDEITYAVIKNADGEFAIMKNHIPLVCIIPDGYIKLVVPGQELYLAIINGMLEFKENIITVIAQGAHIGYSKESALEHLESIRSERLESNRKANIDFTQKEKELLDNIRTTKAGSL